MCLYSRLIQLMMLLGSSVAALSFGSSAIAADKVTLKYKVFRESLSVSELTTFAETGETSPGLAFYLKASKQNPEAVRSALTRETDANVITLDRVLNNPVGGLLLDQVGLAVHPPANVANREAIRSALVLSASGDNKISLLEVIQKYPTSEVEIEGERLLRAYREISALNGHVRGIADNLIQILN